MGTGDTNFPQVKRGLNKYAISGVAVIIIFFIIVAVAVVNIFNIYPTPTPTEKTVINKNSSSKEITDSKKDTKKKTVSWQDEFVQYRMSNNKDIEKMFIGESVLYIYVKNVTGDIETYTKMYGLQFQKEYNIQEGGNHVSVLVYKGQALLYNWKYDKNGIVR